MAVLYGMRGKVAAPVVLGHVPSREAELAGSEPKSQMNAPVAPIIPPAIRSNPASNGLADPPCIPPPQQIPYDKMVKGFGATTEADAGGDDALVMRSVQSSNVAAVGYKDNVLRVRYRSGAVYDYEGVEPGVHAELMAMDSVGGGLSKIKSQYACRRVL